MKTLCHLFFVLGSLSLFNVAFSARAQGAAFTYQGRLNNGSQAASGIYDLRFTLYDSTNVPGIVIAGPIATNAVAVSNGLFMANLDFGPGVFNGSERWLEVAVRTNGGGAFSVLSPRQPLTASPYAIAAGSVSGVIPSGSLSGTYSGPVTFSNGSNVFTGTLNGNGAGVTGVDAATVGGVSASGLWKLNGNAVAPGQFIGSTNNQPLELWAGGMRVLRLEPDPRTNGGASGNLIGGFTNNVIEQPGTGGAFIGGGGYSTGPNIIHSNSSGSFIGAGSVNQVGPNVGDSFIGGGYGNMIQPFAYATVIGGGLSNTNNGYISTIAGGRVNFIGNVADHSFIGGGAGNQIVGSETSVQVADTIAGGFFSRILTNAIFSTIGGGFQNTIQFGAEGATVSGGSNNKAGGQFSTVPGGFNNQAAGKYSLAAGQQAQANHQGTFVWADSQNAPFFSTGLDQFLIRAAGGVGIGTASPAASVHIHNDTASPLDRIRLSGRGSWNGAGVGDTNGIAFGLGVNEVNNRQLWITESLRNNVSSTNLAIRIYPWHGGNIGIVDCIGTDGFTAKNLALQGNGGNVGIGTMNPTNKLHVAGGITCTALVQTSDRNAKENFAPVSPREVLAKVVTLSISQWTYKNMPDGPHMGPMAQDFYAAFGLGGSDKTITSVDPDGVALAAIQGLNEKLEEQVREKQKEIDALQAKVAKVDALEKAVAELSRRLGEVQRDQSQVQR